MIYITHTRIKHTKHSHKQQRQNERVIDRPMRPDDMITPWFQRREKCLQENIVTTKENKDKLQKQLKLCYTGL